MISFRFSFDQSIINFKKLFRGLEDVLIFSVDNLKGISEAIEAVFPQAEVQKCIIYQIRNSLRYVSWKKNWGEIATFFKYPPEIRTLIYTRNPIESLHRQIKIVAKNKSSFPNEQALTKLVYLAVEEAARKWTMRHRDWAMIHSQLMIFFEDRLGKYV